MSLCTIICIGTLALCKGSGYGTNDFKVKRKVKAFLFCLARISLGLSIDGAAEIW